MTSRGTDYLKKNDSAYKKREILAAYNSNGDWRSLYVELGVKKSTAYRWIEEGNKLDVRGGRRFVKVTEQHREYMVKCIERNPRLTLEELRSALISDQSLTISKQAIRSHLDAMLYTIKSVRYEPERANHPDNKLVRK